jgi:hypothetical protein
MRKFAWVGALAACALGASAPVKAQSSMLTAAEANLKQIESMVQQLPSVRDSLCSRQSNPSACRGDSLFQNLQTTYDAVLAACRKQVQALKANRTDAFDEASDEISSKMAVAGKYMRQIRDKYAQ